MKIAVISDGFSEGLGYVENNLPKCWAKLGLEVHLIASDLQIYGADPETYRLYEPYLGPAIVPTGTKSLDGFTLHRIPHYLTKYGIGLKGLKEKFEEIRPDIVYIFEINMEYTLQVVEYKLLFNYKIFSESRLHLSVYHPPKTFKAKLRHYFTERKKWASIGKSFEKLYPIAPDVFYVITHFFGQSKSKCEIVSLGVNADIYKPITSENENIQRKDLRFRLGFSEDDIVCIYTGRFTDLKGTLILPKAIDLLHQQGKIQFKALLVGAGDDNYIKNILSNKGCIVHPFVQSEELVKFYQAADIGVWPKQESTSQLDAIASGLAIIISSKVDDKKRIDGNGLCYEHENYKDMALQIESLENSELRTELGQKGLQKIKNEYSWDHIAALRLADFKKG